MRWFAGGGREIVGDAGPVAQLDERISLACRDAPGVRGTVGARAGGGELLDQGADQAAVFGVQPALQREAPVAPGSKVAVMRSAMVRSRRGSKSRA